MTKLPGIVEICHMPSKFLPAFVDMAVMAKAQVSVFYPVTTIEHIGDAECSATETNENNGMEESTTLSFRSLEFLPNELPLAFLVRDVNSQWWLIGAKEAPGVLIRREQSLGVPSGNAAVNNYTIEYTGKKSLIPCLLFR